MPFTIETHLTRGFSPDELTEYEAWRELGFDEIHAWNLTLDADSSYHEGRRLVIEKGVPLAWAYELL